MHAWEQIKFEVMALGLVSLLLVVFEVSTCPATMCTAVARHCQLPTELSSRMLCKFPLLRKLMFETLEQRRAEQREKGSPFGLRCCQIDTVPMAHGPPSSP